MANAELGRARTVPYLITGAIDPVQGFMSQQYDLEGPVAQGPRLAPIVSNLSENVPS